MGWRPSGRRYVDDVWKLITVAGDGSFELDMRYFSFHHSADQTFNGSSSSSSAPRAIRR